MKKCEICGFEHLHLHTDFSLLDGYGMVEEYALRAPKINQKFLTVSDHGMMGVVPRQIKACENICKANGKDALSPIFACELYVNRLQPECNNPNDMQKFMKGLNEEDLREVRQYGAHLLAIAYNETGYKNLVRLSSWGWTKGFYRRPRVNYDQLIKHREGLFFTSCCYASEVGKAFDRGLKISEEAAYEAGYQMIQRYLDMFGREHYFLEMMLLDFKKQKPYDKFIVAAAEKFGLRLIITNDCHYCQQEDSHYQRLMLMVQTNRTLQEIQKAMAEDSMQDFFELQDANLWMKSEEEINEKWLRDYSDVIPYELFCEAKRNTVWICNKAKGVKLDRSLKLPVLDGADEKLKEEIMRGFAKRGLPKTREYLDRIKEEYSLIWRKGFSSYFLLQKMMTDEARRVSPQLLGWGDGSEAVGPGRGSAVGALTCY
jgi:DNA polymerase-3 subunit alpha